MSEMLTVIPHKETLMLRSLTYPKNRTGMHLSMKDSNSEGKGLAGGGGDKGDFIVSGRKERWLF